MKKIKLNSTKLQLKKQKIASLTNDQMSQVMGGDVPSGVTNQTCCLPTDPRRGTDCNPLSGLNCTATCQGGAGNCYSLGGATICQNTCNCNTLGCV